MTDFKKKIYFVYTFRPVYTRIKEFEKTNHSPSPEEFLTKKIFDIIEDGDGALNWIIQTYLHLKNSGCNVCLSDKVHKNEINVIYYDHISKKKPWYNAFIITVQADRPRPGIADSIIVQNKQGIKNPESDHFILHWPQYGMRYKEKDSISTISKIAYFGREDFLEPEYRSEEFKKQLRDLGVELILNYEKDHWNDYSGIDAVVAIRDIPEGYLATKPASKLVNSWLAGCIPFLSEESAYRDLGDVNNDYFEISSNEELLDKIKELNDNQTELNRIYTNITEKRKDVTVEKVKEMWINYFNQIIPVYEDWRKESLIYKLIRHLCRILKHMKEDKSFSSIFK